jgi:hypothetical protein
MKRFINAKVVAVLCIGLGVGSGPSQAQTAGYMWCSATATNGVSVARYYSGVFPASASEATAKAAAFRNEVEDAEISAAAITANCYAAADEPSALRSLNANLTSAPGTTIDWAG